MTVNSSSRSSADIVQIELCNMIVECCSQERTYSNFYGLIGERFQEAFAKYYDTIHRYETNKLRNIGRFFGHLLASDGISWAVLSCIKMNEDDTTSSSRIFVKIMMTEMIEEIGLNKVVERFKVPELRFAYQGMLPMDNPKNTRFAINYFTAIGMGKITEDMRAYLADAPRILAQQQAAQRAARGGGDSSSESDSSEDSSDLSSSELSSSDSESESDSESDYSRRGGRGRKAPAGAKGKGRRYSSDSRSRSPSRSRSRSPPRRRKRYSSDEDSRSPPRRRRYSSSPLRSASASRSPVRRRADSRSPPPATRRRADSRSPPPPPRRRLPSRSRSRSRSRSPPPPPRRRNDSPPRERDERDRRGPAYGYGRDERGGDKGGDRGGYRGPPPPPRHQGPPGHGQGQGYGQGNASSGAGGAGARGVPAGMNPERARMLGLR